MLTEKPPIREAIGALSGGSDDVCLLYHHEDQLSDLKKELHDINTSLLMLEEDDELTVKQVESQKGSLNALLTSRGF